MPITQAPKSSTIAAIDCHPSEFDILETIIADKDVQFLAAEFERFCDNLNMLLFW